MVKRISSMPSITLIISFVRSSDYKKNIGSFSKTVQDAKKTDNKLHLFLEMHGVISSERKIDIGFSISKVTFNNLFYKTTSESSSVDFIEIPFCKSCPTASTSKLIKVSFTVDP